MYGERKPDQPPVSAGMCGPAHGHACGVGGDGESGITGDVFNSEDAKKESEDGSDSSFDPVYE